MFDEVSIKLVHDSLKFYVTEGAQPGKDVINQIRNMIGKPGCPSWLVEPRRDLKLYRGLSYVSKERLNSMLGVEGRISDCDSIPFTGTIKPIAKNAIMSFSDDREVVRINFTYSSSFSKVAIIFTASVKDNPGMFIDLNAGFYDTDEDLKIGFRGEREYIALGPVKLERIAWCNEGEDIPED